MDLNALLQTGCREGIGDWLRWGTVTSPTLLAAPVGAGQYAVGLGGRRCALLARLKFFIYQGP